MPSRGASEICVEFTCHFLGYFGGALHGADWWLVQQRGDEANKEYVAGEMATLTRCISTRPPYCRPFFLREPGS
jgi:hypothetical protein